MGEQIQKAQWICGEEFLVNPLNVYGRENEKKNSTNPPHPIHMKNYHMLVRKTMRYSSNEKVWLDITADDYYKLYINGCYVGQGPAPSYETRYYYNHYDVTPYLKEGENVIGVHIYYQGNINRVWNSGDLRQGMQAICYTHEEILAKTDDTWIYKRAEEYVGNRETGYHTQYLEDIDMRNYTVGWNSLDFEESEWKHVFVKKDDDHILVQQETDGLDLYEVFPETIKELKRGIYLLDFGREMVGYVCLNTKGEAARQLKYLPEKNCWIMVM